MVLLDGFAIGSAVSPVSAAADVLDNYKRALASVVAGSNMFADAGVCGCCFIVRIEQRRGVSGGERQGRRVQGA